MRGGLNLSAAGRAGSQAAEELRDAVGRFVEPGMAVHFVFTHNRAHAAALEVARQFRDRRCLDLVGTGLLDYGIILAAAGALRSGTSAFAGMTYPAPAPSPGMQQLADAPGSDPDGTNLTITLRLMAGALGLPAVPTRSLVGTDLATGPGRATVADPFEEGGELMLLQPIRPDVAFVHLPIADTLGNSVVEGPFGEDLWGAWAARRVVVTAERVVSPAELAELGPRIGLPAGRVDAVIEVPYGAHPQAQYVWDPRLEVTSYAEDYDFRLALRRADRDPEAMHGWLEEWVFGSAIDDYLGRLGEDRLARLRAAATESYRPEVPPSDPDAAVTPQETAAVVAMRTIERLVGAGDYRTLFAGIGLSHLAAWSAMSRLTTDERPELVAETGLVGFTPSMGDPYLFNYPNSRSAALHDGFLRMLGCVAGGRAGRCLAVLAAGEISPRGEVNSSRAGGGRFIVGSGGANDIGARDADVLLVMPLTPRRTPERLNFVTTAPRRLAGLASDVGLLEPDETGELVLTTVIAEPDGEEAAVSRARERCGWPLRVAERLARWPPPEAQELATLRAFDPEAALLG